MLRGILGVSRRDHMRNEEIRRILHLSPIEEVMRSGRLRWFGHVQRRDATNVTHRVMELAIPGTRRRGRPKKTWHQQMKEDMAGVGVTQENVIGGKILTGSLHKLSAKFRNISRLRRRDKYYFWHLYNS